MSERVTSLLRAVLVAPFLALAALYAGYGVGQVFGPDAGLLSVLPIGLGLALAVGLAMGPVRKAE